jgi:sortase A
MWQRYLIAGCLLAGLSQLLPGAWILAKAQLAQVLIADAWASGDNEKPWPWADTLPVMRMRVPRLGIDLYVLEGSSGDALAFGPGLMRQSGVEHSGLVISGHRDTHFEFLQALRVGDFVHLKQKPGPWVRWRVSSAGIVDSRQTALQAPPSGLLLVTCYPFDALTAGGPLRYVVGARRH